MNKLVVFAPGWSGLPKASYNPLLMSLANRGYDTLSLEYDVGGIRTIPRTAHICQKIVAAQREKYDDITVVGHSMGGLVCRLFDEDLYERYVSIGTPHQGTSKAYLGYLVSEACREMVPNSKFLQELDERKYTKPRLAISAHFDFTCPNARWEEAENQKVPFTNHISVIWAQGTVDVVDSWIRDYSTGNSRTIYI